MASLNEFLINTLPNFSKLPESDQKEAIKIFSYFSSTHMKVEKVTKLVKVPNSPSKPASPPKPISSTSLFASPPPKPKNEKQSIPSAPFKKPRFEKKYARVVLPDSDDDFAETVRVHLKKED